MRAVAEAHEAENEVKVSLSEQNRVFFEPPPACSVGLNPFLLSTESLRLIPRGRLSGLIGRQPLSSVVP